MRYFFGDYVLDSHRYELHRGSIPIKVRPKVFDVLAYLVTHREREVPKQELLDQLWPRQFIGDATLNSCIMEARQAVGDNGQAQRIIHTRYGRGYRFVAPVESPSQEPLAEETSVRSTGPRNLGVPTKNHLDTAAGTVSLPEVQGHTATSLSAITGHAPPTPGHTPTPSLEGEHKQITILACTLANAMGLTEALGSDGMHGLMHGFFELAQREIQRYEGTITQYLGDGFVALFGAPMAHEDHAQRGLLAAVGLQRSIGEHGTALGHTSGQALAVRIGLHTGSVVVGSFGDDRGRLFTAVGPTTQVATQLQHLAEPGTTLLSEAMRRLLDGYISVEPCDQTDATAQTVSSPAYKFIGLSQRRSPRVRRAARALGRFVGRQQELATLYALLARAESGQGQVVGIVGEAGLGKSRLLDEFHQSLQGKNITYLEGRCLSYGQYMPYLPVLDLLRHTCGITDAESPAAITTKVRLALQEVGMDPEAGSPLLLHLLGLPVGPEQPARYSLEAVKMRIFATLQQLSLHGSRQRPLILEVEDLHWVDATSEEWFGSLVDRLTTAPIMLLTTYRPGYRPPWVDKSYATQLALPRLTRRESQIVVQSTLHPAPITEALFQAVLEKGQGNPFFLEELARALVERRDDGPTLAVPDTVQAVLAARIDRLTPEARHLLQTAAVIGTDVSGSLLQAIVEWPDEPFRHGLAQLQAAEFLEETHRFPEVEYRFKHALTQQVAYETLIEERRRVLHARLVEALEALTPERAAEQVDRLAHHALRGEVWGKAVTYCQRAGARAHDRAAFGEAVASFDQALHALAHLREPGDTRVLAIGLRRALGGSLVALGECGRWLAVLGEAESLARALDNQAHLGWVLAQMAAARRMTGDLDGAIAAGQQALALAVELGDSALQVRTSYSLGMACQGIGDFRRAADLLRRNVEAADREPGTPSTDMRIRSQAWLARALGALGAFAEGRRHGEEALRLAMTEGRGDAPIVAHACLGRLYLAQGDLEPAIRVLERGLALCRASGDLTYLRAIATGLGTAVTLQGRLAEGGALLEEAITGGIRTGALHGQAHRLAWLSEVCRLAGRGEEAWQYARRALNLARQYKERANEALALHQLGTVQAHADSPDTAPAEASYQQALVLAEELGMRPLQAHCHHGLGRLYHQSGCDTQARTALATAIDLYRAMAMTFWLPQAEAAMASLTGGMR